MNELDNVVDYRRVCAIVVQSKGIGVSFWNEESGEILTDGVQVQDPMEVGEIIQLIKRTCNPNYLVLPPHVVANKELLDCITTTSDLVGVGNNNNNTFSIGFTTLKTICWNAENAVELMKDKLYVKSLWNADSNQQSSQNNNNTSHISNTVTANENYLRISSLIDMDNSLLKQSMGGLLNFMQKELFNLNEGYIYINLIKSMPTSEYMRIDMQSFYALDIFAEQEHPNFLKGRGRSKEGFSIFGLFDRTKSLPGRHMLRNWMLRPFYNRENILHRQDGVGIVVDARNFDMINVIGKHMSKIHSIPQIMLRIKKVVASHTDWSKLHISLKSATAILQTLNAFQLNLDKSEAQRHYISTLFVDCNMDISPQLVKILEESIDFNASQNEGLICIHSGHDAELDRLREIYNSLEDILASAAQEILQCTPLLNRISVEYATQVGYLAVIDAKEADGNPEIVSRDAFTFLFSQDNRNYYKHRIVEHLDDDIGDIHSLILDRQKKIVRNIEDVVLQVEIHLQALSTALSSLDAVLSLGVIAKEMEFVRPDILQPERKQQLNVEDAGGQSKSGDNTIIIKQGRHPLQELTVDQFVPNDSYISNDQNVVLVTGSNGSGKSVYLKQIGVIVFLAHLGSWVPCEKAVISLTDRIMTRIRSIETAHTPSSSFALDLSQINRMLTSHTPQTLCIIDEFGKGTAPADGIALLATVVTYFTVHKAKAVFSLHFTEILRNEIISEEQKKHILLLQMETISTTGSTSTNSTSILDHEVTDEHVPLYRVAPGVSQASLGISCARAAGIPEAVVNRAAQIKKCRTQHTMLPPHPKFPRTSPVPDGCHPKQAYQFLLECFLPVEDWTNASEAIITKLLEGIKSMKE